MKPLTQLQEKFAQLVVSGMTQADAYRGSFSADKMKPETIHKRASEMMAKGEVMGRVDELRKELSKKALWTREESVEALKLVLADGRGSEVVSAIKELNSMHGYNAPIKIDADVRATINIFVPEQSEDE